MSELDWWDDKDPTPEENYLGMISQAYQGEFISREEAMEAFRDLLPYDTSGPSVMSSHAYSNMGDL